ncbi:MAG: B12-binding domain-containing radical SAM protein [Planctomycetes bacterium]|nr:B12-binding domain-containing radical SAM protein [Planctomycetota bacterium]
MSQQGSLLLVSCYELGHQPLGLASPAAFLERAGYSVETLDVSVEELDRDRLARARFVGISVPMHTALRLGARVAARVRELNPAAHVCFYGLYALLNADYLLERLADSAVGGEYEEPLVALVRDLEAGGRGEVSGVYLRGRPSTAWLRRLPFPVPARRGLPPLESYAHLERDGERVRAGTVEASRGCAHLCLHCPIPPVYGGRFFVVPREVVLQDVRRLVADGAGHVTFGDPDFLNGPAHALAVARELHARFPALTFDFTAKVEHLLRHRALLPELARLGCVFVVSAVESLSDVVLANLEKGHTRADVFEALAACREAGIAFRPSFVAFTPWTTLEDYLDVLDALEAEGLVDSVDAVQYSIRLLVPPGSLLLSRPALRPHLGGLEQAAFHYTWTHPDPAMDRLHADVSAVVEEAARAEEDAGTTFLRIRRLAEAAAGRVLVGASSTVETARTDRPRPPHLTEPWFC